MRQKRHTKRKLGLVSRTIKAAGTLHWITGPTEIQFNSIHFSLSPFYDCSVVNYERKQGCLYGFLSARHQKHGTTYHVAATISDLYGCKKVKAKCSANKKQVVMNIHPDWSLLISRSRQCPKATVCKASNTEKHTLKLETSIVEKDVFCFDLSLQPFSPHLKCC